MRLLIYFNRIGGSIVPATIVRLRSRRDIVSQERDTKLVAPARASIKIN